MTPTCSSTSLLRGSLHEGLRVAVFATATSLAITAACAVGHPFFFWCLTGRPYWLNSYALHAVAVPVFIAAWIGGLARRWVVRRPSTTVAVTLGLGLLCSLANRVALSAADGCMRGPAPLSHANEVLCSIGQALLSDGLDVVWSREELTQFPSQWWLAVIVSAGTALITGLGQRWLAKRG